MESINALIQDIHALLPMTQCKRCGTEGCLPYAEAIAREELAINRCPPGGAELIGQLSRLTGQPPLELDPSCGLEKDRLVALIDESQCIGCTKCLPPCPVDAIIGGPKRMHSVDLERCTGCELCLMSCPVSCISMVDPPSHLRGWSAEQRRQAQQDYASALQRRQRSEAGNSTLASRTAASGSTETVRRAAQSALALALQKAGLE